MDNTPFGNFCSLNLVIITIALSFLLWLWFTYALQLFFSLIFFNLFWSTSLSTFRDSMFNLLKYLKSAMITSFKLLLECVLERQSRTMKEIFNSICNARASIFRAICALQRLLFSESSSISKTRRIS